MIRNLIPLIAPVGLLLACASPGDDSGHEHDDSWAVTAWGEHFEIFAETPPLVTGKASASHTHVTFLYDFSPVEDGKVSVVLVDETGRESVFSRDVALRPGIFDVEILAPAVGVYDLRYRVDAQGFAEEIPGGRVRVGTSDEPGGRYDDHGHEHGEGEGHSHEDEGGIAFLKEQQWKIPFGTAPVAEGEVHRVVSGTGLLRPVAGGEVELTAPLDGVIDATVWPYPGMEIAEGAEVFHISPRAGEGRSLAELEAHATSRRAELELARDRLSRLEELLEHEATSRAEVDAARALVTTLAAETEAAERNLRAVRSGGRSASGPEGRIGIIAPLAGRLVEVRVTPGELVSAGSPLGRVVRTVPVWVEVHLPPHETARPWESMAGLLLRGPGSSTAVRIPGDRLRFVSRSPMADPATGNVSWILEIGGRAPDLPLGSSVEAGIVLPDPIPGIVIPVSAVVDDAGIPVVFVQQDGESFERREVNVRRREGDRLLVDGLALGERLVTTGAAAVRRASLVSSDVGHGHVH